MKPKFLKLNVIHPNNIEGDTTTYVAVASILHISEATVMDKKHRAECNTLIFFINGMSLGVSDKASEILEQLEAIE